VAYVEGERTPTITEWGKAVADAAIASGIKARIMAEPGRAIVAQAALTLYTAGTIKEIPGVRTYVSVDGGMSDNPRPVLYGSGYEVFAPMATTADRARPIRLVGKHCESGDVLAWNAHIPEEVKVGDLLATPVTGAYGHSMGSNYNMARRPAGRPTTIFWPAIWSPVPTHPFRGASSPQRSSPRTKPPVPCTGHPQG
jgi:diaminopimelate decarboxylase